MSAGRRIGGSACSQGAIEGARFALPASSIVLVLVLGFDLLSWSTTEDEHEHEHENEHDWGRPSHAPPLRLLPLAFRQMDSQQCDVRRGDPADPARLPKGGRSDLGEFLPGFKAQASDIFVIEPVGNILRF